MRVNSSSSVNGNKARSPSWAGILLLSPVFTPLLVAIFAVLELFIKSTPPSITITFILRKGADTEEALFEGAYW
jgi:hypothetical protein